MSITSSDLPNIRAAFPSVAASETVFFDNPGGTQVTQTVIDAVTDYYLHRNANVGAAFDRSQRTDAIVAGARAAMAHFLGASDPARMAERIPAVSFNVRGQTPRAVCERLSEANINIADKGAQGKGAQGKGAQGKGAQGKGAQGKGAQGK